MAAGIFFAETFQVEVGRAWVVALLLLLLALGLQLRDGSYTQRWLFGAGVSAFMFLTGMCLVASAWKEVKVDWSSGRQIYQGVVVESLQEKPKSFQCRADVAGKEVLLYFPKDSASASVRVGDELLFYTRIDAPANRDGFQEFDYARYLYHDGVSGTAFVPADAWRKTEGKTEKSLKLKALMFRERVMDKYVQWGIGREQLPVFAALTLGHQGDLDKETRTTYSIAGIAHVLALSGMHIAIVWLLLDGLLKPLMKKRLRWLKWLLVTVVLWAFAFVVGLEASVVRAVVMCMLMELGRLSGARPLSMNTLAVAAFFMLIYRPFYLFDVGFQLSFVAVASILLLYPRINALVPVRNRVGRWMGGMMSVSVAAQLGTAPLVMYYFSSFSVYFLLANLVAAVLVPLILYGAFLMVLCIPVPLLQRYVVDALNALVSALNGIAEWTSGLPYATFSFPILNPSEICLFYGVLLMGLAYWKTGRRKWLIRGLAACACLLALHWCLMLGR